MSSLVKSVLLACASMLGTAGAASASLVLESWDETNPGALTAGTIPGGSATNDVLDDLGHATLGGYYGSQISLTSDATVTYTLLGFEAAFSNQFVAGGEVFDTETFAPTNSIASAAGLASFTRSASAGLLDFSFLTRGGAENIVNGEDNTNNVGNPDFFASIVGDSSAVSGNSLYLFLDDLGAGPDDDHDDLVVRVDVGDVVPIPVPAGIVLMGTALAGLGFMRRKQA